MSLLLASKTHWNLPKDSKDQTMLQKRKYANFQVQGLKHKSKICKNTENKALFFFFFYQKAPSSSLDSWLPSISRWSPLKVFAQVIFPLLTLTTRSSVWKLIKKMPLFSLYWFLVQQQTRTNRLQKFSSLYSNISVEESECTPAFWDPLKVA